MKKLLLILLLLAGTLQSYSNPDGQPTAIRVAYIQIDRLVNELHMYKDLQLEFATKLEQQQQDYASKDKAFQKQLAEFNDKISNGQYSGAQAEQAHASLLKQEEALSDMKARAMESIAAEEAHINQSTKRLIADFIGRYNETEGYSLILTTTADNMTVIYALPGMDITDVVIKGLNKEYTSMLIKRLNEEHVSTQK